MYQITMKEIEKDEDYYIIDHPSITIEMTNSMKTLEILKGMLPEIGPVKKIVHNRGAQAVFYPTFIEGPVHTILVKHAFTSGYRGTGAKSFGTLLQLLGISDKDIERLIYAEGPDKAIVSVEFQ